MLGALLAMFILIWMFAGIGALIMSIVCFGYGGSTAYKIVGLVISLFLGPFYWIYYIVNKDYCTSI